mmetsp:Transcript_12084/g.35269  ORF Transcript_12084/g.35269 Transcript_12084/m.35269 type:complete len:206 (-) Transcript_12084:866-1483(-)
MKTVTAFTAVCALFLGLHSFAFADAFSSSSSGGRRRRRSMASLRPQRRGAAPAAWTSSPLGAPRGGGGGGGPPSPPLSMSPGDVGSAVFTNAPLVQNLGIICATNAAGFVLSVLTGSFLHVDLLGAGAFGFAALPALMGKGATLTRIKASSWAVAAWSAKLAAFLFARAVKSGHDKRVSGLLETTGGAGKFALHCLIGLIQYGLY